MMNGIGGETFVEYTPASLLGDDRCTIDPGDLDGHSGGCSPYPTWVVKAVTAVDTFAHAPALTTHYGYREALFDGYEREARGFGFVWEVAPTGVTKARAYHQDTACAGRLAGEYTYASAAPGCYEFDLTDPSDPCNPLQRPIEQINNNWDCENALASIASSNPTPVLLQTSEVTPFRRPTNGTPVQIATDPSGNELTKLTIYDYDDYGNEEIRTISSPSTETLTVRTEYESPVLPSSGALPNRYVVSRPSKIYSHYGIDTTDRFQEKTFSYSSDFAVTAISECQQWGPTGTCASSLTTSYSGHMFGMPREVSGPGRATTSYTYDDDYLIPVVTTHPDKLMTVVEDYDYRIGREVAGLAKNGERTETLYDGLGRLRKRWGPNFASPGLSELSVTYKYPDLDLDVRGSVKRETPNTNPTITFYDGFAREVATKQQVEIAASGGAFSTVTRIEGLKVYDDAGRVKYGVLPYKLTSDPNFELLVEPIYTTEPSSAHTAMTYDLPTGALSEMRLPDQTVEKYDPTVPGIKLSVDAEGVTVLSYADALGRTVRKDTCAVRPAVANDDSCSGANLLERIEYTYDGLDRVVETRAIDIDAPSNPDRQVIVETVEYDGQGNVTKRIDANSSVWRYAYDTRSGLLVRTYTPRGDIIRRRYDAANRVSSESVKDGSKKKLKSKTKYVYYDVNAGQHNQGRLQQVLYKGPKSGAATETSYTYNSRGLVATESVAIHGAHGDESSYTTSSTYDEEDKIVATTYPSQSDGSDDLIETFYYGSGRVAQVTRNGSALADAGYDVLGHLTYVRYANNYYDLALYETAEDNSYLRCLRTTRKATGTPPSPASACTVDSANDLRAVEYAGRDLTGRITWIRDLLHTTPALLPSSNEHTVTYYPDGRISSLAYATGGADTFDYDGLGRLTRRGNTSFYYDWTFSPHPTTFHEQPYAVSRIVTGSTTSSLDYDLNGNRTDRGTASYLYTPSGGLAEVADPAGALQQNGYGPDGNRIVRYDDGEVAVHYYGNRFEVQGDELVRHFYLGNQRIASDRIIAPPSLSLGSQGVTLRSLLGSVAWIEDDWPALDGLAPVEVASVVSVAVLLIGVALAATAREREGRLAALTASLYLAAVIPGPAVLWHVVTEGLAPRAAHAQEIVNTTVFYHADHIGSPQAISNSVPAGGTVGELIRYDVFGKTRGIYQKSGTIVAEENPPDASTSLGYTGHEPDEATGLVYFGVRHLDPIDGHFLSIDPARQYASPYVHGNYDPLNGQDPDGGFFQVSVDGDMAMASVPTFVANVSSESRSAGTGIDRGASSASSARVRDGDTGALICDVVDYVDRAGLAATGGIASPTGEGAIGDSPDSGGMNGDSQSQASGDLNAKNEISEAERRVKLAELAAALSGSVARGEMTSLDALVRIGERASSFGADGEKFVNDLGATLSATTTANVGVPAGIVPDFDASGFRSEFQDPSNQVRHFAGALVAGAEYGEFGGQVLNTGREILSPDGARSMADIRLGNAAAQLGAGFAAGNVSSRDFGGIIRSQFGAIRREY